MPILSIACATFALHAETHHVFGPPRPGHARPPLHINATPSGSASYIPAQIRHAYGFDQVSATGAGQKLAIVVAYGNPSIQANLNTFCSQYGLSTTTIQIIGNNAGGDTGWALEAALDVEWAHAIAPGATLLFSVARSSSLNDLLAAVDAAVNAGANVVSMSWGATEFSGMSNYDSHFNRPNVTFTAASGDNGAGVEWPATSPYVVGVGGTTLYLDANNNRTSETAWSGSGGGVSSYYSQPAYQSGWQSYNRRGVPDVSFVSDPNTGVLVYDAVNGGWFVMGGTSAAAPQWAGLAAVVNEIRATSGSALLAAPHNLIYSVAKAGTTVPYTVNTAYFFDVLDGSNGAYTAGPPYDFVTGIGSPVASTLVPALAPVAVPSAPTGLTATAQTGEIDLKWTASSGATSYTIGRSTTSTGPFTAIASGLTSTSYRDTSSLVAGTRYYYVVAAVNSSGTSPNSGVASAVVPSPTTSSTPAAPSNLRATAVSSSQINLFWVNNASNATGIAIEVAPPGSGFFQIGTISATATSCSVSGAASKTTYSFRIRAYNSAGYSPYSNTAIVTTY